jgi:hypothetical protein
MPTVSSLEASRRSLTGRADTHPDLSTDANMATLKEMFPYSLDHSYQSLFAFGEKAEAGSAKIVLPAHEADHAAQQQRALLCVEPFIRNIEERYPNVRRVRREVYDEVR